MLIIYAQLVWFLIILSLLTLLCLCMPEYSYLLLVMSPSSCLGLDSCEKLVHAQNVFECIASCWVIHAQLSNFLRVNPWSCEFYIPILFELLDKHDLCFFAICEPQYCIIVACCYSIEPWSLVLSLLEFNALGQFWIHIIELVIDLQNLWLL